jgi:hypothetical protein
MKFQCFRDFHKNPGDVISSIATAQAMFFLQNDISLSRVFAGKEPVGAPDRGEGNYSP